MNFVIFMIFVLIISSISIPHKRRRFQGIKNDYDLVSVNQMIQLGWKDITWESVDELNRCLYTYGITTSERIRHFLSLCSVISSCGKKMFDSSKIDYSADDPNPMLYQGSGYLHIANRENYEKFSKHIGDHNIVRSGAQYVAKHYPWTSAGFLWSINNANQFCKDKYSYQTIINLIFGGYSNFPYSKSQYYLSIYDIASKIW